MIQYRPDAYAANEAEVVSAFEQACERGIRVVLNLDGLDTLDTDGVRGLITLLRRARALKGELALRASKPSVLRTLEVTALDRIFPMADTEAA
ncbi:MAG TPA: STAS domain-containing protein [Candidatus Acidoferrales bacterium]|nr:STAS domain-containing protein [Candidatus Acidoferrales bacterium]